MEKDHSKIFKIILAFLFILDLFIWPAIFYSWRQNDAEIYFLDVGQGDSSLIILPGGVKILIDGGPMNGRVQKNLEAILPVADRYIDLMMISHPQMDHFGGFLELMKNYHVGAVLMSEYGSENVSWKEFERVRKEQKIPRVVISQGDRIVYGDSELNILWPGHVARVKDLNDVAIGFIIETSGLRAFFGADIGLKQEEEIARLYDVNVDVLKVGHHGSKYSSDLGFLKEVSPLISIIEVGKNSYGHPTKEALARLGDVGSKIFRTDVSGFVKVFVEDGKLQVYTQK